MSSEPPVCDDRSARLFLASQDVHTDNYWLRIVVHMQKSNNTSCIYIHIHIFISNIQNVNHCLGPLFTRDLINHFQLDFLWSCWGEFHWPPVSEFQSGCWAWLPCWSITHLATTLATFPHDNTLHRFTSRGTQKSYSR